MTESTITDVGLRQKLRAIKVFPTDLPEFDTDAAPANPLDLLTEWVGAAIDEGVAQPHAMVLATATASGIPSARTLLLKDVTSDGVWFASLSTGGKGHDLDENPACALVMYWREQGRQIRVTGEATKGPREVSEADFLSRHPRARAGAIGGDQGQPLPADRAEERAAIEKAAALIEANPEFVPDDWNAYVVAPATVEFWQAGPNREETRLRYARGAHGWFSELIWP